MEKGERGNEMANGNEKPVGMDDERMGKKKRERRGEEDGEERMEENEKGENTEGNGQSRRGNKGEESQCPAVEEEKP